MLTTVTIRGYYFPSVDRPRFVHLPTKRFQLDGGVDIVMVDNLFKGHGHYRTHKMRVRDLAVSSVWTQLILYYFEDSQLADANVNVGDPTGQWRGEIFVNCGGPICSQSFENRPESEQVCAWIGIDIMFSTEYMGAHVLYGRLRTY
ncbi:hypothetical protein A0H81_05662 [Grifola frondosa]|uniref:Uncharacterized protein n=1 Tax=Grifola frondosa TaxID=5627 RepID=A0A1C7MIY0_GRIFR|nr:hypothetical protein A0H81_05662 [Grifola frondosa]